MESIIRGVPTRSYASNINKTYDEKTLLRDLLPGRLEGQSWLTLNLGLRWDYFGPLNETNGGQANFVPSAPGPFTGPTY